MTEASSSNEYATSWATFNRWHRIYRFDVDAAAAAWNAKLPRYWTKKLDGLKQLSRGLRVFFNPPYSRGNKERWTARALQQVLHAGAKLWGGHLPANTSERWWTRTIGRPLRDRPHRVEVLELPGFANGYRRFYGRKLVIDVWFYEARQHHRERSGLEGGARFANAFVVWGKPAHMPTQDDIRRRAA